MLITLSFLPFVISQIVPTIILYPFCLNFMPEAKGQVSAIIQRSRLIFASLALQITGYFYQGSFRNIGIVLVCSIFIAVMGLFLVTKNTKLMDALGNQSN